MEAIFVIASLSGLVWALLFVLRGSLLAGCIAYLVLGASLGASFWKLDVAPMALTLDRLALVPLAAAFLVQRFLGRTRNMKICGLDLLLMALLGWLALSTFSHDFRGGLSGQVSPIWRLVAGYMIPAGIYFLARQARYDQRAVSWVQGSLLAFATYLAITGILEVHQQWWGVFPKHIANPDLGMHFGRARGPMLTSVSYGLYVVVGLICCLGWRPSRERAGAVALFVLAPLLMAGIYYSYTRSVWLGTAIGLPIVLGLTLRGRARNLVVAGLVGVIVIGGALTLDKIIGFQREYSAADTKRSAVMRAMFVHVSWKMFQDRPLIGVGFGHFPARKLLYLSDRSTEMPLQAIRPLVHHNTLLSLLTEAGAVGMILFMGLLIGWARLGYGMWRAPSTPAWVRRQSAVFLACLGVYLAQLLFHELSYSSLDNALVFFLAGVMVAMRSQANAGRIPAARAATTAGVDGPASKLPALAADTFPRWD